MGETTAISWTDSTFNPWVGCTKVGPGCDHCYAATADARFYPNESHWGPDAPRRLTSAKNWNAPLKWDREAEAAGKPRLVFCASQADVFDNEVPEEWRDDLWALIDLTPKLAKDATYFAKQFGKPSAKCPACLGRGYILDYSDYEQNRTSEPAVCVCSSCNGSGISSARKKKEKRRG